MVNKLADRLNPFSAMGASWHDNSSAALSDARRFGNKRVPSVLLELSANGGEDCGVVHLRKPPDERSIMPRAAGLSCLSAHTAGVHEFRMRDRWIFQRSVDLFSAFLDWAGRDDWNPAVATQTMASKKGKKLNKVKRCRRRRP